jgi:pimeloyl-ACP methyl ester carboxylesterase
VKVIRPLSDPAAFGGDPRDAFNVVVPSLPGFGFSTPLAKTGIAIREVSDRWVVLMREVLGYKRFAAQGGDIGALVSTDLGHAYAEHLIGVHLNLAIPLSMELSPESEYSAEEKPMEEPERLVEDIRSFFRVLR